MATLKQRLHRKNSSGAYDVVHLETSASCVNMDSGVTVEAKIATMDTTIAGKAASSHGTHVTFSTTAPVMNGTASVGSATTVSRSDHVHPTDTSRAASSHNHAASNITSGTLAVARGGTGVTANPSLLVNLGSTSAASVFATSPRPGVTGTLPVARGGTGVTSLDALKTAMGISSTGGESGGTGGTSGSTTAGGTMTFDNMSWIVVDNGSRNSNERVLILKDIYHLMQGYNIERFCLYFWNYVLSAEARAKCTPHHFNEFGDNAYTMPVFVPTYTECNGGFSYFSSNANRIANYNGTATAWWTSSPNSSDGVDVVTANGLLDNAYPNYSNGFRPCVALKI